MYVEENDYFAQDAPRILTPLVYEGGQGIYRSASQMHFPSSAEKNARKIETNVL